MNHYLIDWPARIVLFPILVGQALAVRRRAQSLPEADGPRSGVAGDGPPLRLLIVGDSSAAGVGVSHQDQALSGQLVARLAQTHQVSWRLEAETGRTTRGMLDCLSKIEPEAFDIAVSALAVNDVTRAIPLELWLKRQSELWQVLHGKFGVRHICLSGLPPMGEFPLLPHPLRWILGRQATRFDTALRRLVAQDPRLSITDMVFDLDASAMAEDGFHPGPEVYSIWADRVFRSLSPHLT